MLVNTGKLLKNATLMTDQSSGRKNFCFALLLIAGTIGAEFVFSGCANQLPPSGGDVDRTPPEITRVYPADGTINFRDDFFEIEFSEYIDKRSFREAVFISPYVNGNLEFNWNGTAVEVSFPEKLKDDITYTITIGTDVVDRNNNNRMASSFSFSFSTGAKIDKKLISGKIYGKETEGIFIYAYKVDSETDTLLIRKPDYISQSGANGQYSLYGLASGKYRVFAVNDKFKDLIYQQDIDEIGIPFKDVILNDADSIYTNLNFMLLNADTTKPGFISCIMTDRFHLLAAFNKEIDFRQMSARQFNIIDSTSLNEYEVKYLFKGKVKPEELILVTVDELNLTNQVYITADSLVDMFGNVRESDYSKIIVSDRPDSTAVMVFRTDPVQDDTTDFINAEIKIYFDDAINKKDIISAVSFSDTLNNTVPFNLGYDDDATLVISAASNLKQEKNYIIKLDIKNFVDAAGNNKDTVHVLKFKTISGLDFTGLSGRIVTDDTSGTDLSLNTVLILENPENKELNKLQILSSEYFEFTRVEPGKYLLWGFSDEDGNGEFNYGYPAPFRHSEKFFFYPDTLNLRPRWEITDLQFKVK